MSRRDAAIGLMRREGRDPERPAPYVPAGGSDPNAVQVDGVDVTVDAVVVVVTP